MERELFNTTGLQQQLETEIRALEQRVGGDGRETGADSAERIAEIKRKTEEKRKKLVSLALTRPRTICRLCARRRGERRATSDPSRGVALAGGPQGQEQEAGGECEAATRGWCECRALREGGAIVVRWLSCS